jgi:hypothetical protein
MRPRTQAADQNQDFGSTDCAGLPPTASATLYSAWVAEPEAATGAPPPDAFQPPSDIVIPGPSKYVLLLKIGRQFVRTLRYGLEQSRKQSRRMVGRSQ